MNSRTLKPLLYLTSLFILGWSAIAPGDAHSKSAFYVTVLQEIEGLHPGVARESRPLVDPRAVAFISPQAYAELVNHLSAKVSAAYGDSVVSIIQLGDVLRGPIKFVPEEQAQCGDIPSVPLSQAYVIVFGVSRASYYEIRRDKQVDIFLPFTVNIQVIKPDKAKILFSSTKTIYSYFGRAVSELDEPTFKSSITNEIVSNIKNQIDLLTAELASGFKPKPSSVTALAKDGDFIVVDKGFEVGFKDSTAGSVEFAINQSGQEVAFEVVSVDDGYSVLRSKSGSVKIGEKYDFLIDSPADDSRKPRLMPVVTFDPSRPEVNGVMETFSKAVGFKAPFQIAAVDVNFAQTMDRFRGRARCIDNWDKYPAAKQIKNSRSDVPHYLLLAEVGETPVLKHSSSGEVKSKETFGTVVNLTVVDFAGNVLGSGLGSDIYVIEKTVGQGLSLQNAKEISLRNASTLATKAFLDAVKLSPKSFIIKDVTSQSLFVEGLSAAVGIEVSGYVQRPLKAKVNGRDVVVRLPTQITGQVKEANGKSFVPFESGDILADYMKPKAGDSLVIFNMPNGNMPSARVCSTNYIGTNNSVESNFSVPFAANALFSSKGWSVKFMPEQLRSDANVLLEGAYFKDTLRVPALTPSESCMQLGYVIRQEKKDCKDSLCSAEVATALAVRSLKDGASVKDFIAGRKIKVENFQDGDIQSLLAVGAFREHEAMLLDLSKKLNAK